MTGTRLGRPTLPGVVRHAAVVAVFGVALGCGREPGPSGTKDAALPTTPSARKTPAANDGTDATSPVLSPDDAQFTDTRKGFGWGDRCFIALRAGKLGWARASCDRGLALPDVDPKARAALLYNEGLISKKSGDAATARSYFAQSLALRPPTDPGRALVEKELATVGGAVEGSAAIGTAVPQLPPADLVHFYLTLATMHGVDVTEEEIRRARDGDSLPKLHEKLKAPFVEMPSVYFADINNDGSPDYVLCDTHTVGLHNRRVVAVYQPHNASFTEVPLPGTSPFGTQLDFDSLRIEQEGTTMSFAELGDRGAKRERFLWKGGRVRLLGRAP